MGGVSVAILRRNGVAAGIGKRGSRERASGGRNCGSVKTERVDGEKEWKTPELISTRAPWLGKNRRKSRARLCRRGENGAWRPMTAAGELLAFAGVMALGQFSPGPDMLLLI